MQHQALEDREIDMLGNSHGEWKPWCETVGFIIRRVTRRRFNVFRDFDSGSRQTGENVTVEFDILTGLVGHYVSTGLWSLHAVDLQPIADPVCTPVSFAEALSPQRISTHLSLNKATERLLESIHQIVSTEGR